MHARAATADDARVPASPPRTPSTGLAAAQPWLWLVALLATGGLVTVGLPASSGPVPVSAVVGVAFLGLGLMRGTSRG